jgi:hypothetical protein
MGYHGPDDIHRERMTTLLRLSLIKKRLFADHCMRLIVLKRITILPAEPDAWYLMRLQSASFRKALAGSALLLWSALSAVVPAADAISERDSVGAVAHVESTGGSASCIPVHDQVACQLCRLLRVPAKSADTATLIVTLRASTPFCETAVPVALHERDRGNFSRAPPSA